MKQEMGRNKNVKKRIDELSKNISKSQRQTPLNSNELYAPFKDIDIATLEDTNTGHAIRKAVKLPPDTKNLLERIGMTHVALPHK